VSKRSTAIAPRTGIRVVYLPDPAVRHEVVHYSPAQLAAKRREQQRMYLQWKARQLAIAEHDRKVRRFCLGFGAIVGLGLLATLATVVWWLWHAITTATVHVNGGLVLGLLAVLVVGAKIGHRCVTTIQHWH
jgi:hypothetical protein